ncbi:CBS domain-containing protein [Streptomyces sp. NPDC006875]|uniref:CBS domain-containing protein n=1 Tax=Streptomyces sp. NPDC006875 TaxID=3154781 RepID=UPI0033D7FCFB
MHASRYTVSDVMTHTVVAVSRDATFKKIVEAMDEWKVSAVPVLEADGRVIGVVSEADLLPKEEFRDTVPTLTQSPPAPNEATPSTRLSALTDLAKAGAVTATELMATPALTIHADATLPEAARIMARRRVKRLPVTDSEGMLKGIVSRGDLLKVFLRSDDDIAEEVRHQVIPYVFAHPAEPVRVHVRDGVVTLTGEADDPSLTAVAARLIQAVEGVVDVECDLSGRSVAHPSPPSEPR